ncbi:MAG: hypothetical protein R3B93_06860 [Bacteroidia bacterium]
MEFSLHRIIHLCVTRARDKIKTLDFVSEHERTETQIKEITQLGLEYNLLTEYTFIAVDNQVRLEEELQITGMQGAPG